MPQKLPNEIYKPESEEDTSLGLLCRVILFNDDWHSFDEVIEQLIKAIKCGYETARDFTFEVHVKGKATVYEGEISGCLKVTSILEEIALHTQIVS